MKEFFLTLLAAQLAAAKLYTIPNQVHQGPVDVKFRSSIDDFDSPKLSAINQTVYDWWYFDGFSPSTNASVSLTLYTSVKDGFAATDTTLPLSAALDFSFANGTRKSFTWTNENSTYGSTVIATDGEGASGNWQTAGVTFFGSKDLSHYEVLVNAPHLNITGTISLKSRAPAHYPCGPAGPNQPLQVAPTVGWANAIPDGDIVASFDVQGVNHSFSGIGYHDKNWGSAPFTDNIKSWDWGHGRIGEYSLVWFDVIGADDKEYVSGYVAKDGIIIEASCQKHAVMVRPTNGQYPPTTKTAWPDGFTMTFDIACGAKLDVMIQSTAVIFESPLYVRWKGILTGGIQGQQNLTSGSALWEEFNVLKLSTLNSTAD